MVHLFVFTHFGDAAALLPLGGEAPGLEGDALELLLDVVAHLDVEALPRVHVVCIRAADQTRVLEVRCRVEQ